VHKNQLEMFPLLSMTQESTKIELFVLDRLTAVISIELIDTTLNYLLTLTIKF